MNQVAEKKNSALATFDMEADAQQGTQNISQEDLALPFLKILGQLSPEVNKRDGKYVEGAEPGKIINTVTNELFDKISVVPCHYKRQYIETAQRFSDVPKLTTKQIEALDMVDSLCNDAEFCFDIKLKPGDMQISKMC